MSSLKVMARYTVLTCALLWLSSAVGGCSGGTAAAASGRGIGGTAAAPSSAGPEKWAVVIGVGDYEDPSIGDLPNAVNDARAVREALTEMVDGFPTDNMAFLADGAEATHVPTRANIMRYLSSYLSLAQPDDTVLLYFAGHGVAERGQLYLLPRDASSVNVAFTGFPFAEVERLLRESAVKRTVLILDACHSGTGRSNPQMSPEAIAELERASKGMVILASCSAKELSHEMPDTSHGAFTHFFLEAIRGQADRDKDGLITASEVSYYTWDATRRWAAKQGFKQTPWRREEGSGEILLVQAYAVQRPQRPPPVVIAPAPPVSPRPASYSASSEVPGYGAALAFDGNPDTSWQASSSRGWLEYKFGRERTVSEMEFETNTNDIGGGVPQNFEIELCRNGQWVQCHKKYGNMKARFKARLEQPTTCTAFRIRVQTIISDSLPLSIAEVTFR